MPISIGLRSLEPTDTKIRAESLKRYVQSHGLLLVCFALCLSCGTFGDRTRDVYLVNGTGETLVVFSFDRDPRFAVKLEPGQSTRGTWRYPLGPGDQRRVRVEAENLTGQLVYCRNFSYTELEERKSRIDIVSGDLACQ